LKLLFLLTNRRVSNFFLGSLDVLQELGRLAEGPARAKAERDGNGRDAAGNDLSRRPGQRFTVPKDLIAGLAMLRTTQKTVVFERPFLLPKLGQMQPSGAYTIETDEELMPPVMTPVYRRVSTHIYLHEVPGDDRITGVATIDPDELDAALARDLLPPTDPM
jgi:hypothetical protein